MLFLLTISADFVSLGPQEIKADSLGLSCREEHPWWENEQLDSVKVGEKNALVQRIYLVFYLCETGIFSPAFKLMRAS